MTSDTPSAPIPPGLTAGDMSLLTGPYVELTPARLEAIQAGIEAHQRRYEEDFPALVRACPDEVRLAVACWVMKHVYAHAKEGGSYRYLIYERLGFGPDAYAPMMFADALNISNEFVVPAASGDDEKLVKHVRKLFMDMPVGEERSALIDVYLRFEELAAFARAAREIIDRQRRELHERASG